MTTLDQPASDGPRPPLRPYGSAPVLTVRSLLVPTASVVLLTAPLGACGRSPVPWLDTPLPLARCGTSEEDYYAQQVQAYDPQAGGGARPEREDVVDPAAALGAPDHQPTPPLGTVSIGDGGTLSLTFGRCVLVTGPGPDLVVHEAGFDERVTIAVRPTPTTLEALGPTVVPDPAGFVELPVDADPAGGFDIDVGLPPTDRDTLRFDAVRIRDVIGQGLETVLTPGADIDAVEAVDVDDPD